MRFGVLGIHYKNAPLAVRGNVSFTDTKKLAFFQKAKAAGIDQCMAISTCNRSEVFYFYEQEGQPAQLRQIYQEIFPLADVSEYLHTCEGEEAIAYLFRIAAGLESMVLGEDQILGQVKDALDFARTMGYSGKELNKVVRDAVTCAKRLKTEWKISEKPLSVSYVGIQRLKNLCGIQGKRVLVIGSGKTAALAMEYLYEYGAGHVTACSRTDAHARLLLKRFPQTEIIAYQDRYRAMQTCDIVVSATASPHLVIRREAFEPQKSVVFLDLAAPRDVDPAFFGHPYAHLIDLDTLKDIVSENHKERRRLVEESQKQMEEDLKKTALWLLQSRVDPAIASLQQRCDKITEDSFSYLNRKIPLGAREQKILKKTLHASLQRLLREPIQELKRLDTPKQQEEFKRIVEQLFRL